MTAKQPYIMQLTVHKLELERAIKDVSLVVENKTTIPIVACVKLTTDGEHTTVQGTDLDRFLTVSLEESKVKIKNIGTVVIPAQKLAKTLQNVKTVDADAITVTGMTDDWVELQCGELRVKLPGMAKDNWPVVEQLTQQEWSAGHLVEAGTLRTMIARSRHAISDEESRHTINAALLKIEPDRVRMCTTDGHRLVNISRNGGTYTGSMQTLVNRDSIDVLHKLLEKALPASDVQCAMNVAGDRQHFYWENSKTGTSWTLTSRTVTGPFPNYEAVMPKVTNSRVIVDAQTLLQSVKRVGMYTDARSGCMRFELVPGKGLLLKASNPESGDASEMVKLCVVETPEATVKHIAFNHRYVLDILGTFGKGEQVELGIRDHQSAAQWKPVNGQGFECTYVVMPMRD